MPGTMARRTSNAYESRKGDDGLEALSNILSADLRGAIRALGTFPLLSEEWCNMAKTLGRIAEVSEAEAKLSEECHGQGHGKDSKTLWEGKAGARVYLVVKLACQSSKIDNIAIQTLGPGFISADSESNVIEVEGVRYTLDTKPLVRSGISWQELALRYVLEEGKLNVCLRNLVELREFQRKRRDGKVDLVNERPSTRANLDAFEKGMGVVLRNAWTHIEALQTTDIPLLVRYITEVFREAADDPRDIVYMSQRGGMQDRQEVVCLSYFRGLISSLSEYDEGRVMPHVRSAGTTASLASMLHVNHKYLGTDAATVGARALALVFDTEDYATYRDDYISNPDKDTFASLKGDFVADLCKDPLEKKTLRPLLDVISYCQRTRIGK